MFFSLDLTLINKNIGFNVPGYALIRIFENPLLEPPESLLKVSIFSTDSKYFCWFTVFFCRLGPDKNRVFYVDNLGSVSKPNGNSYSFKAPQTIRLYAYFLKMLTNTNEVQDTGF